MFNINEYINKYTHEYHNHLDNLTLAFIQSLRKDDDYGYSWGQDVKRPFGNSGYHSVGLDILLQAKVFDDISEFAALSDKEQEGWISYAHLLMSNVKGHLLEMWKEYNEKKR